MSVRPWTGTHRFAIVPVFNRQVDGAPPADWEYQIRKRMFYDPDPKTGLDRSFQHYLQALSYGRAFIEGDVFPPVWADDATVNIPAMESLPPGHGYKDMIAILPHSFGNHRGGWAFMDVSEVNGITSWARIAMFDDRDMTKLQPLGVWAMEILHVRTRLMDLYNAQPPLGAYDVMSSASASVHASAHSKELMGWLPMGRIVRGDGPRKANLHAIGLMQPPPPDRVTAVRIPSRVTANHFMVEARAVVDQYEMRNAPGDGLPTSPGTTTEKEGVIVYEVRTDVDVMLRSGLALGPGEQYNNADEGITVVVEQAIPGGFAVSIQATPAPVVNRSAEYGSPSAASAPAPCVIRALGSEVIAYCATNGHLYELWRDAYNTGTTDLTANANAPKAKGQPVAYYHSGASQEILLYRATNDEIHSLYWSTGAVGHDNLSGTAGAPKAAGNPVGYYTAATDTHHVVYRQSNGHLRVMWWVGLGTVGSDDATGLANAPAAAGDPSAYVDTTTGTNVIVYRGTDGNIRSLYWVGAGALGHDDLSGFAGTPKAAGDPFAYYSSHNDAHQIVYRAANGHIYELYWAGQNVATGWDITPPGAPAAASDPVAYYESTTNTKHVIYRSANGDINEIWWVPGGGTPAHTNLTAYAGAPPAVDKPCGWVVDGSAMQHVAYRGTDGAIYEIRWG